MSVYSDHIRLWNEGKLPDDLSVEKLMGKHTSQPRNPKMAEAFYRAGFIEAWGRGIEKIVNGFKADGLTPPTFSIDQGGVTVHIPREKFVAINLGGTTDINQFKGSEGAETDRPETDQKSDQKNVQENVQENLTDRQLAIIEIIVENKSVSLNDLAVSLGVSVKTIQRDIEKMSKKVRRVGPDKGGKWEVIDQ